MKVALPTAAVLLALAALAPAATAASPPVRLDDWLGGPERVLLTAEERRLVSMLGADEVDRFIAWFWQRRDPDASTAVNEFRADFNERVARARKLYDRDGMLAWETAPGLLYVLFGEPRHTYAGDRAFADGAFREVTVWEYADPRDGRSAVHFYLIATDDGLQFAVGGEDGPTAAQPAMIEMARRSLVRATDGFGTVAPTRSDAALPAVGSAVRHADGVLVHLTLSLRQLLGAPLPDGILYTFDAAVDTGTGRQRLGVVQARVGYEQVATNPDRDLQLVAWFPLADAETATIEFTEMPAGRSSRLSVAIDPAIATSFEIAREVCVTHLLHGAGAAVAFFSTSNEAQLPVALLHAGAGGDGEPIATSRLYLDRLVAARRP